MSFLKFMQWIKDGNITDLQNNSNLLHSPYYSTYLTMSHPTTSLNWLTIIIQNRPMNHLAILDLLLPHTPLTPIADALAEANDLLLELELELELESNITAFANSKALKKICEVLLIRISRILDRVNQEDKLQRVVHECFDAAVTDNPRYLSCLLSKFKTILRKEDNCVVDMQNIKGETLLMVAANNGNEAVVDILLEEGASLVSLDYQGNTVINHIAALVQDDRNHNSAAKIAVSILEQQDEITDSFLMRNEGEGGCTPLAEAAIYENKRLVKVISCDRYCDSVTFNQSFNQFVYKISTMNKTMSDKHRDILAFLLKDSRLNLATENEDDENVFDHATRPGSAYAILADMCKAYKQPIAIGEQPFNNLVDQLKDTRYSSDSDGIKLKLLTLLSLAQTSHLSRLTHESTHLSGEIDDGICRCIISSWPLYFKQIATKLDDILTDEKTSSKAQNPHKRSALLLGDPPHERAPNKKQKIDQETLIAIDRDDRERLFTACAELSKITRTASKKPAGKAHIWRILSDIQELLEKGPSTQIHLTIAKELLINLKQRLDILIRIEANPLCRFSLS